MKPWRLALPILAAATVPAAAQGVLNQSWEVSPGTYAVEPDHTQITFSVLHLGFTYFSGFFSGVSGTLRLDPEHPQAAALSIAVPIASVATTSKVLDGALKGPKWFDAAAYPIASFVATSVTPTGANTAAIAGNLTLHGVTHQETLNATFIGAGINPLDQKYTIGFEATATIKRGDFGVTAYLPAIGNDVSLVIAAAFERR